jgi:hypothetical protein
VLFDSNNTLSNLLPTVPPRLLFGGLFFNLTIYFLFFNFMTKKTRW